MPSFFDGISRLIAQLLQEKEKSGFRAEDWLLEEAAKPENVQRAGTFRYGELLLQGGGGLLMGMMLLQVNQKLEDDNDHHQSLSS